MNADDFVSKLRSLDLPVFSVDTASTILGKPKAYAALYLQRLLRAGKVGRIERNKYYLPDADIYTIASRIVPYSYISMYAALEHYALTTQVPKGIEVIAPKYHKAINVNQQKVWFYKVKKLYLRLCCNSKRTDICRAGKDLYRRPLPSRQALFQRRA